MGWKEFFKFTKKKIFLFSILLFLSYLITWIYTSYIINSGDLNFFNAILSSLIGGLFMTIVNPIMMGLTFLNIVGGYDLKEPILILINVLTLYIWGCIIYWIFGKIKNRNKLTPITS